MTHGHTQLGDRRVPPRCCDGGDRGVTVWGIRRESRNGTADVWYGLWPSRHAAAGYLAREAYTDHGHNAGALASVNTEWCTVEPIEWVPGRDTQLRAKNVPDPGSYGSESNTGGSA